MRYFHYCVIGMLAAASASLYADTIVSENFDELTPALTVTSAGLFQTTGGTNVDIAGPGNNGALCAAPESGNCIDMGGSGGNSVGVLQLVTPITLQPGITYYLSFDLVGSGRGPTTSTMVTFGSYSQTFTLPSLDVTDGIVVNQAITVSSTTTTNLVFTDLSANDNIGSLLDNVLITSNASGTPEPGTAGLVMLLGLGGGILLKRRG